MSGDHLLRKVLEDAIDDGKITEQGILDVAHIVEEMQRIVEWCTPQDSPRPQYNLAVSLNDSEDDFCSFFLKIQNNPDLSTFENRRLSSAEAVFARVGAMFVDYGLPYEENHDGLLLIVHRYQQDLLKQLSKDMDDAIKKTGAPVLDITYQPR